MPPGWGAGRLWEGMIPGIANEIQRGLQGTGTENPSGSPARTVCEKMVHLLCQYEWLNLADTHQSWRLPILQTTMTRGSQEKGEPNPAPHLKQPTCTDSAGTCHQRWKHLPASSAKLIFWGLRPSRFLHAPRYGLDRSPESPHPVP